jgi:hypothetical protein
MLNKLKKRMNCICRDKNGRDRFDSGLEALVYTSILFGLGGGIICCICAVLITTVNILI